MLDRIYRATLWDSQKCHYCLCSRFYSFKVQRKVVVAATKYIDLCLIDLEIRSHVDSRSQVRQPLPDSARCSRANLAQMKHAINRLAQTVFPAPCGLSTSASPRVQQSLFVIVVINDPSFLPSSMWATSHCRHVIFH